MKILLQSTLFYPSVGGIETVSMCLAEGYVKEGHQCTVITRSSSQGPDNFSFSIARNPSFKEKMNLIRSHDVIHCNGASLELVLLSWFFSRPVVWTHAGYQMISIDGLGWHEGEASPLDPWKSFVFHAKKQGLIKGMAGYVKLLIRRWAGGLITQHVAITNWVAGRQPLPGQVVMYNPFPLSRFQQGKTGEELPYDFFFLGRLVSEKGAGTLISAFALFLQQHPLYAKNILLIGEGNWRPRLEALARESGLAARVDFIGKKTGKDLLNAVAKGRWAVVPSEWEEPMGGVALEMLAAGKPVIVSQNGGLAECAGTAGLLFPNGDEKALAAAMSLLYSDAALQEELKQNTAAQAAKFSEKEMTLQYLALFNKIVTGKRFIK